MEEGNDRRAQLGETLDSWASRGWDMSEEDRQAIRESLYEPKSAVIRVVTGLGATLAALLSIITIGIFGGLDSEQDAVLLGICCTGVYLAFSAFRKKAKGDFLAPFVLTVGIIGQVLIAVGLAAQNAHWPLVFMGFAVEGLLLVISSDSLQRVISTVLILLCFWGLVHLSGYYFLIHPVLGIAAIKMAYLWTHEAKLLSLYPRVAPALQPIGLGFPLGIGFVLLLTVNRDLYSEFVSQWWGSTLGIGIALAYALYHIVRYYEATRWGWLIGLGVAAVIVPTAPAPGVAFALLVVALGFFRSHKILLGLGLASLIAFTIAFYYNVHLSLLWKSLSLLIAGIALLGLRWGIQRMLSQKNI